MPAPQETTWQRNAPSQIVLNSIFAALDGALAVIIIQDPQPANWQIWPLVLLVISFFLFAISAEKCVVALDERDVKKWAYYLLPYNLGVIGTGFAIGIMMYVRFDSKIRGLLAPRLGTCSHWVSLLGWFIVAVIFLWTWIYDTCWLLLASKKRFEEWLEELEDKRDPEPDHGYLMKGFYGIRKLHG